MASKSKPLVNIPFRRVYMDLPDAAYQQMTAKARAKKMTNKEYMASLIEADAKRK